MVGGMTGDTIVLVGGDDDGGKAAANVRDGEVEMRRDTPPGDVAAGGHDEVALDRSLVARRHLGTGHVALTPPGHPEARPVSTAWAGGGRGSEWRAERR